MLYEPQPAGAPAAREAVAAYYRARGITVEPGQVMLASGTSEAYSWLFKLLCDPGDEILIPKPSYPLFDFLAGLEAVRPVPYWLAYDGRWWLDWQSLEAAAGARSKAVVVVQPNNPTGSLLNAGEIERLAGFCAERGLAIISDEVFADYPLEADLVPCVLEQEGAGCFVLGGLSKAAGLPQMKLSWIVAGGPASWREAALRRLELIADTYLSVGTPVQCALPALLEAGRQVREQIRLRVRHNYEWLKGSLAADPVVALLAAEAGWYAVLRVPPVRSEEEWCVELLVRQGVLVEPGYFYDFAHGPYLVVSLLTPPPVFQEGIRRLREMAGG